MKWIKENSKMTMFLSVLILTLIVLQFVGTSKLSREELNTYIDENQLDVARIQEGAEDYTILLIDNDDRAMFVYKDILGRVVTRTRGTNDYSGISNDVNVEYWGTNPFSLFVDGYIGIDIKDEEISRVAYKAELILDNDYIVVDLFEGYPRMILQAKRRFFWEKPRLQTVKILDKEGNVIDGFFTTLDLLEKYQESINDDI